MYTADFNIFTKMVDIVKQKGVDYVIMYVYQSLNNPAYPHMYSFVLASSLFTVTFEKKFEEDEDIVVREFLRHNDCVELDCKIKFENGNIKLH